MSILDAIVAAKQQEVRSLPDIMPAHREKSSFVDAILAIHPSLIAEIKPKSPSSGHLLAIQDVPKLVELFDARAQAISVLCDEHFFGGSYDLLRHVRSLTNKPLLAKEFIIDSRQIDHAADAGADAILLIATILSAQELVTLTSYAITRGLDVLIEVHSIEDIEKTAQTFKKLSNEHQHHIIVGMNNRDLASLKTDIRTTEHLVPLIRSKMPSLGAIIAESGISTRADVEQLTPFVQGFLIGTSILQSKDPAAHLASLFPRPKPLIKFCGFTNVEDVQAAEALGVDYIGFVFAPESLRSVGLAVAQQLRRHSHKAKVVGVFTDHSLDHIEDHVRVLQLDFVQLHGKPDLERVKNLSVPVIQALRGVPDVTLFEKFLKHCPFVLIDKADGEDEADFDAIAALPLCVRSKLFLAGGLTPGNIRNAVDRIQPYAVDCARGVESQPGIKDHRKVSDFLSVLTAGRRPALVLP